MSMVHPQGAGHRAVRTRGASWHPCLAAPQRPRLCCCVAGTLMPSDACAAAAAAGGDASRPGARKTERKGTLVGAVVEEGWAVHLPTRQLLARQAVHAQSLCPGAPLWSRGLAPAGRRGGGWRRHRRHPWRVGVAKQGVEEPPGSCQVPPGQRHVQQHRHCLCQALHGGRAQGARGHARPTPQRFVRCQAWHMLRAQGACGLGVTRA